MLFKVHTDNLDKSVKWHVISNIRKVCMLILYTRRDWDPFVSICRHCIKGAFNFSQLATSNNSTTEAET